MKSSYPLITVLLAITLLLTAPAQAETPLRETGSCSATPARLSPLLKAVLAKDIAATLQLIATGADLDACVSELEIMRFAASHKRISYLGGPAPDYPLVILLAVADLPAAISAVAEREPAQLHKKDPHGNSALAWAARLFLVEVVDVLLKQGLDPLQASDEKQTPLSLIIRSRENSAKKTASVRALIAAVPKECFTNIGVIDQVWMAAYLEDFDTLAVLLEAGVPPHYVAPQGRTALFSAVEASNLSAVQGLLAHGARVSSYPYRGKTIFQLAADNLKNNKADAGEIHRLLQIEQEKLLQAGHNPPGSSPAEWNSREGMEQMRLLQMLNKQAQP